MFIPKNKPARLTNYFNYINRVVMPYLRNDLIVLEIADLDLFNPIPIRYNVCIMLTT
jgi:hypothetical protein